ncbi:MAG: efflux RND transporter periplasmic adaptor subunit [Proteobacteria bacterium]|nr:efflux RND transporter periplasmic adaptor subunit [Pseudomonadota bacterium]MBU1688579.1 efflux RND transporter periplasmic adaptor subunit [Pseudomonadota bacterium]
MQPNGKRKVFLVLVLFAVALLGWAVFNRLPKTQKASGPGRTSRPAPVEVAPIVSGPIELRRIFSGALEARAEFIVAPKVSGHLERLHVHLADTIHRGQPVAELDDDEYIQNVNQAKADLAVAAANLAEAESALEIAEREFQRVSTLRQSGVTSDSRFDETAAARSAKKARLEVTRAQVTRAEAALETAKIHLGYTRIKADWSGGSDSRVVAERFVDEGQTVSANAELLRIIELDPITGVIFVTEKDYAHLQNGQKASLTTDAYPGEIFTGHIERIAPVFRQATRQARVELTIANPELRLKPGMFIRATVVLDRQEQATIVPEQALTVRNDQDGVFMVNETERTVRWQPVRIGIRQDGRVQLLGEERLGLVVILGQQLIDHGSSITIPGEGSK